MVTLINYLNTLLCGKQHLDLVASSYRNLKKNFY